MKYLIFLMFCSNVMATTVKPTPTPLPQKDIVTDHNKCKGKK